MGAEGGKLLADAIKAHPNYEQIAQNMFNGEAKVNMSNKGLDAGDAWIMGAALEKNDTVTEVDASSNNLGVDGGKALAECLKTNTTLATIVLSGKGTSKITIHADQLRQNMVETLDYSGQGLHVDGASFIVAELLKSNSSVTKVSAFADVRKNADHSVC